ncbi:RNA 2',3'-cyclic phosphodiesterase [Alicyclobacillus kakegawensis]|uniref:RNA 2',3'-cyclic phosphodiesterase n=1 Tax=Alicyclobacillus kakegawensis TaxID=392012 RepID=UPI000831925D|nr:RNA 2',3'-cyclic phosphodiesterase [Alicyclobacillus kakegawensis]
MARLFIGVELDAPAKDALRRWQDRLRACGVTARWAPAPLLHMTVLFLGEVPEADVDTIAAASARLLAEEDEAVLTVDRLGMFWHNRILWAGTPAACEAEFARVHQRLASRMREDLGLAIADRPFQAHITLARDLHRPLPTDWLSRPGFPDAGFRMPVAALALFASERLHGQLAYRVRARLPFGRPAGGH